MGSKVNEYVLTTSPSLWKKTLGLGTERLPGNYILEKRIHVERGAQSGPEVRMIMALKELKD